MKRLISVIAVTLFLAPEAYCLLISHTIGFNEADFDFQEENGYDIVSHKGCVRYGPEGAPQVLTTSVNFIIPRELTVASVEVTYTGSKMFPGKYLLFPNQLDDYYALCCFPDSTSPWRARPRVRYRGV
jgi:hypothetical protein